MTPPAEPPIPRLAGTGSCHACDGPLAADQRYCLTCGARRGAGGPIDFTQLFGPRATRAGGARARQRRLQAPVAAAMLTTLLLTGIVLGSLGTDAPAGAPSRPISIAYAPPPAAAAAPAPAPAIPIVPAPPAPPAPPPAVTQPQTPGTGTGDGGASTPGGGQSTTADDEPATTGSGDDGKAGGGADDENPLAPIKHVVVIMLAEQSQPSSFTAGAGAPYLSETLVPEGTLVRDLYAISGSGLATSIALLSGQAPNPQTVAGCPTYADVTPATTGADDQEQGEGCVYSVQTPTLANGLERAGLTWRAYVEDSGNGATGVAATCRHPEPGAADPWRDPRPGDAYATARNPFVYFHAIADAPSCARNVVGLERLDADLARAPDKVPSLQYIVPNLCHDGRATPCDPATPAGPPAADAFLAAIVPKLRAAKAYEESLVVVTYERAAVAPAAGDAGGRVGALLLSPFVRRGRTILGRRDTYALSATLARILAVDPLGKAARADARPFGPGLFDAAALAAAAEGPGRK